MPEELRILGIVAEYNPFHNGHAYQLRYAREVLHAHRILVVMSGAFTQRGTPALCDPVRRARAAVAAGADVVAELPVCVATADTPLFAQGAVDVLRAMGCNALLFGSECNDLPLLEKTARAMTDPRYWERFEAGLAQGEDPNLARPAALRSVMPDAGTGRYANDPNNLLGIYYLCGLLRCPGPSLQVFTHRRQGQGYLDEEIPTHTRFASASALRAAAEELACTLPSGPALAAAVGQRLGPFVPAAMAAGLEQAAREGALVFPRDFFARTVEACRTVSADRWQQVCGSVPRQEILDLLAAGTDWPGLRSAFHRHAPPLKADRMLGWLLLDRDRPGLEEFLARDHVGWRVLAGSVPGLPQQHAGARLQEEWRRADALYQEGCKGG